MCDFATASLVLTGLSTVTSFIGGRQEAASQAAFARYNAAVARNNQIIAERFAEDARLRGEADARKKQIETQRLRGRQRVAQASLGQVVDEGSALDLTTDTVGLGKLDELTIRNAAEREALGFEAQATNFGAEAGLFSAQATAARQAGFFSSAGTLLSGASSVAQKWYQLNRTTPSIRTDAAGRILGGI